MNSHKLEKWCTLGWIMVIVCVSVEELHIYNICLYIEVFITSLTVHFLGKIIINRGIRFDYKMSWQVGLKLLIPGFFSYFKCIISIQCKHIHLNSFLRYAIFVNKTFIPKIALSIVWPIVKTWNSVTRKYAKKYINIYYFLIRSMLDGRYIKTLLPLWFRISLRKEIESFDMT